MVTILQFFGSNAVLVYAILLLGLLFALRNLWVLLLERQSAVFGLEKVLLRRRISWATGIVIIIVCLAIAELVLDAYLLPSLPALAIVQTPTIGLGAVPTGTFSPDALTTPGSQTPQATLGTEVSGCIPGQVMITSPEPGQRISGQITIRGTADIPNFGFYKYEVAPAGTALWSTIQAGREARQDGELGSWFTGELTPGDYLLRLVVTDNQGNALPPCVVPVQIVR
ncbi:MAG: hypothetical protein ABIJ39_13760 [Chloroflexota bacterium]